MMSAPDAGTTTPRGWVRKDGLPFRDQLSDSRIYYPLAVTEKGTTPPVTGGRAQVWTGTGVAGASGTDINCNDWQVTSNTGTDGSYAGLWNGGEQYWDNAFIADYLIQCGDSAALYCMEVDYNVYVPLPPPATGMFKWAFVTSATLDASLGVGAFDAECNKEALSAGLQKTTGHFRALVAANSGASPASRFTATGVPFVRAFDNVQVATTDTMMLSLSATTTAAIDATPSGSAPDVMVWFGTVSPTNSANANCVNWTSNSALDKVDMAYYRAGNLGVGQNHTCDCALPRPVYCLQD
jgi:hypothetical protein